MIQGLDLAVRGEETHPYASKYQVYANIHAKDYIFDHKLHLPDHSRQHAIWSYFFDGDQSSKVLDELLNRLLKRTDSRTSLLEFASGYGCVSRHLAKLEGRYRVVACDIHPEAVHFLRTEIGVDALQSHRDPDCLRFDEQFDVVFALSFFSHIPHANWGRWLHRLFRAVRPGGLLVFTAHGRSGLATVGQPPLVREGYWFTPLSEQKDLPLEDYGTMFVEPLYVFRLFAEDPMMNVIFFQEAFWWGVQDTYVIQAGPEPRRYAAP